MEINIKNALLTLTSIILIINGIVSATLIFLNILGINIYALRIFSPISYGIEGLVISFIISITSIYAGIMLNFNKISKILAIFVSITKIIIFPEGTILALLIIISIILSIDLSKVIKNKTIVVSFVFFIIGFGLFYSFTQPSPAFTLSFEKCNLSPEQKIMFELSNSTDLKNIIVELTSPIGYNALAQQDKVIPEIINYGGFIINRYFYTINAMNVIIPENNIYEIAKSPYIKSIYENRIIEYTLYEISDEYNTMVEDCKRILNVDYLYNNSMTGNGVVIAIIDDGINEDLYDGKVIYSAELYADYIVNKNIPIENGFNHGTGTSYTAISIAKDCKLADIEVFYIGANGNTVSDDASILWGFEKVAEFKLNHPEYDVVASCSFGVDIADTWANPCPVSSSANNLALKYNIPVIASAGNGDEIYRVVAPSSAQYVLSIASCNKNLIPSWFSSSGPTYDGHRKPDLTCIGEDITTLNHDGNFITVSGTSYSCPLVSGLVACFLSKYRNSNPIIIYDAFRKGCDDIGAIGYDYKTGYGFPNVIKIDKLMKISYQYKAYLYISMFLMISSIGLVFYRQEHVEL